MKYCTMCGAQMEDNVLYCTRCGAPFDSQSDDSSIENAFSQEDISSNKLMAVLSYLGILFLIPLLAAKDSKYARFHANQGLLNFLLAAVISTAVSISSRISCIFGIIGILEVVPFIFMIIGIINASKGEAKELPIIGSIRLIK